MRVSQIDDATKFDFSKEYYKSAEYFRQEYPSFPSDEFNKVLELHANGVTPKQFKAMEKKEAKKKAKRVGKKPKICNALWNNLLSQVDRYILTARTAIKTTRRTLLIFSFL